MSQSHTYRRFFRILLTIAAYGYLAYILLTYKDWLLLASHFREAGTTAWLCLLAAAALIPLNYFLEAVKWRYLLRDVEFISLTEAQRQVYFGILGAFITPERLGDYPTRATRLQEGNRLSAVALGFVGSMALVSVEILSGLLAFLLASVTFAGISTTAVILASILVLAAFVVICKLLLRRVFFAPSRFPALLAMSFARYLVFSLQLALILVFCGIALSPLQYLVSIPIYYLFVTVLPSLPVADVAIRGSIGALVFSLFTPATAGVAIAAVIVWALNTLLPLLCGTFVKKRS